MALAPRCLLCEAPAAAESTLCTGCAGDVPRAMAGCAVCALPLPGRGVCATCAAVPPAFDAVTAACSYAWPVDRLVHACKYAGDLACASTLAELMVSAVRGGERPDLLVPVPLAPARLAERGFNQSAELARLAGDALGLPVAADACARTRHTATQAGLTLAGRAANVRGAFACTRPMDGLVVALIDDVMTTGATLHEVASVLKAAGAARVLGWIAARTPR